MELIRARPTLITIEFRFSLFFRLVFVVSVSTCGKPHNLYENLLFSVFSTATKRGFFQGIDKYILFTFPFYFKHFGESFNSRFQQMK